LSIRPDQQISVTLTASEWNVVLAQLGEGPYRVVAPLIAQIHKQGMSYGAEPIDDSARLINGGDPSHVPH
jgi:hypothetical protein